MSVSDANIFASAMSDAPAGGADTGSADAGAAATITAEPASKPAAVAADAGAATAEPEGGTAAPAAGEGEQHRMVPLRELLDERDKRKDFASKFEEREREILALQRQLAEARRPPQEMPDVLDDPAAFAGRVQGSVTDQVTRMKVDLSFDMAHEQHGKEFEEAFHALKRQVDMGDTRLRDQITRNANPGRALMNWHREQTTLREIGEGGLTGYRERTIKEAREALMKDPEFRKELLASMRAEAGQGDGRPSNVTSIPSLNRTSAAGRDAGAEELSDAELFRTTVRR